MRSVVCASPEYLQRKRAPQSPEALLDHNCLLFAYSVSEWTFLGQGEPVTVRVSGRYRVNNGEAVREALLQGMGIARVPTFVVGPDLAAKRLVRVLADYQMPEKTVYVLFPKRQHLPAKVRVFVDFVAGCFGDDVPYWEMQVW